MHRVITHIYFISMHHDQFQFVLKLFQLVTKSIWFSLKAIQKCQCLCNTEKLVCCHLFRRNLTWRRSFILVWYLLMYHVVNTLITTILWCFLIVDSSNGEHQGYVPPFVQFVSFVCSFQEKIWPNKLISLPILPQMLKHLSWEKGY